jgi:glycosyltransferase involved in cell wall biosynthesis
MENHLVEIRQSFEKSKALFVRDSRITSRIIDLQVKAIIGCTLTKQVNETLLIPIQDGIHEIFIALDIDGPDAKNEKILASAGIIWPSIVNAEGKSHEQALSDLPISSNGRPYRYLKYGQNLLPLQVCGAAFITLRIGGYRSEISIRSACVVVVEQSTGKLVLSAPFSSAIDLACLDALPDYAIETIKTDRLRTGRLTDLTQLHNQLLLIKREKLAKALPHFLLTNSFYSAPPTAIEKRAIEKNEARTRKPASEMSIEGTVALHIFKVTHLTENSGGAIRGMDIVGSLAKLGVENHAVLPIGKLAPAAQNSIVNSVAYGDVIKTSQCSYYSLSRGDNAHIKYSKARKAALLSGYALSIARMVSPRIVHAHSGVDGFDNAVAGLQVARKVGAKFIYEVRSFHESTWSNDDRVNTNSDHFTRRLGVENAYMKSADAVVTICETMKREMIVRGVDESKIFVVPNCVDLNLFDATKANRSLRQSLNLEKKFVLGYLSNMHHREGHLCLIAALKILIKAGLQNIHCLFFGSGQLEGEIRTTVNEDGLQDYVTLYGEIEHEKAIDGYSCYDLFVIPRVSDYAGNFVTPMKPFEAMALGVPILTSNLPALREIVGKEQERGYLFDAGSAVSLANQILAIMSDYDTAKARAAAAREWIEQNHSLEVLAAKYLELYQAQLS